MNTVQGSALAPARHKKAPAASPNGHPILNRLFQSVPIEPLVLFRVAFGLIMLIEVERYFHKGWVQSIFVEPPFLFTYSWFEWVKPWPGPGMTLHFLFLGLLAAAITVGFCYRVAAVLFFLGFTYVFLLEEAVYLNHFYFVCLLSFLLIFVPAHRAFSLDARLRPSLRSTSVPAWTVWLLRSQLCIVYFMAGIAKLNADWLQGQPMHLWLQERGDFPLIGQYFGERWMAYLFSYAGLLFDLMIAPLLLWSRTRWLAFVLITIFNLTNARLFNIGIFPWLTLSASLALFLPFTWLPRKSNSAAAPQLLLLNRSQQMVALLFSIWVALQIFIPLRHWLYPGNPEWTEEGHRFSWRMKLRDKKGELTLLLHDPSLGKTWELDPLAYITERQFDTVSVRPEMILQLCHYVATTWQSTSGGGPIEMRVRANASLNGRPYQTLIDPSVDLLKEKRKLGPSPWIQPLTAPLQPPR